MHLLTVLRKVDLPMSDINSLQQSLQQLESELSKFGSAKQILDDARSKAEADLKNWKEKQDVSEQTIIQLVDSLSRSNDAALKLVDNVSPLAERIIVLAKAIDNAGFPHRLDLIQSNISIVMTAAQALQSRIDLLEANQGNTIKLAAVEVKTEVDKLGTGLTAVFQAEIGGLKMLTKKLNWWLIGLGGFTLLGIAAVILLIVRK
jgi:hypothetical protein